MTFWRRLIRVGGEGDGPEPESASDDGPSVGEQLRERRLARGLTTADVERDIRINRLYLEALEDGDFEALPAPVYARGFMRAYARYLGLDPETAATEVPRDLPRPSGLEPLPGLRRPTAATLPAFTPRVRFALVAVAIALLAALAWFAFGRGDGGAPGISIATSVPTAPVSSGVPAGGGSAPPAATVLPFAPGAAPDVRNVDRDVAVALLESLRLVPVVVEERNAAPAGRVFEQSPAAGSAVQEGDVITLFVSTGPGN